MEDSVANFNRWLMEQNHEKSLPRGIEDGLMQLLAKVTPSREVGGQSQTMNKQLPYAEYEEPLQEWNQPREYAQYKGGGYAPEQDIRTPSYTASPSPIPMPTYDDDNMMDYARARAQYEDNPELQAMGEGSTMGKLLRSIIGSLGGGQSAPQEVMQAVPQQQPNIYPQQPNEGGILDLLNSIKAGAQ